MSKRARCIGIDDYPGTASDLLWAGCLGTEYPRASRFRGRPNGAFTYYALKTLRENQPATHAAWSKAIRAYLPSLARSPRIPGSATARWFKVIE